MEATVGDRIVVAAAKLEGHTRDGKIIKMGSHGAPPYVVRWSDDGRETLLFPGPDAHVSHHEPAEPESAFATIALGQMANAFACRSETQPVWRRRLGTNRLLIGAIAAELVLLGVFLGFLPLARLLGDSWPTTVGWALALCAVPIVIIVDASYRALRRSRSQQLALASVRITSDGQR